MKVVSVKPVQAEIVKTDEYDYHAYRRSSSGHWEVLTSESWETVYPLEAHELEIAYQAFKKEQV